ncbi:hypothetical protein GQ44DRAFT_698687 [Phaeosphaeriaceae sp. PMI808]|nr:hypothetical protein GQ44DRAFT_698687 [Phaeosphaeriaceae sp. PMI808]
MIRQRKYQTSEPSISDDGVISERPSKVRKSNIYDAVAGNVTQAGLLGNVTDAKASRQALRPDEVLFKQSDAPIRYEETDYYFAHENLPAGQQLPSGDLLGALHAYVSKLYSRNEGPETETAWKSMDETALIAFGILMEETARDILGETGDFAFIEAAYDAEEDLLASEDVQDEQNTHSGRSDVTDEANDKPNSWSSLGEMSRYSTDDSE